jgi:hypothetical protein
MVAQVPPTLAVVAGAAARLLLFLGKQQQGAQSPNTQVAF